MTETIHYISDFTYFSERKTKGKFNNVVEALRAHIKYITRKAEGIIADNLDVKAWIGKAKQEITKRWDSRVALKFVMALPKEVNRQNAERYIELVKNFISTRLNVDPNEIGIALHLHTGYSGEYNPHAHILVFPKTKNGRKLRLNRKDLSEFHREWQNLLKALGYRITKNPEDECIPHLGQRIHYDPEAQELYRLRLEIKELKERVNNIRESRNAEREQNHRSLPAAGEGRKEVKEDFIDKQKKALRLHFERLGYKESDKLAIVLINHREGKTIQRVMPVKEILNDKTLSYLRAMNSKGYSIYASINTLKHSATRRRKEDFEPKQKRIYLDLDSKELPPKELIAKLFKYLKDNGLPQPTHIVKSSKGNYQVYWVLDESVDWQKLERIMEKMNNDLGLDHTQDVSRVFRLPYFRNKKPNKDDLVVNIDVLKVTGSDELLKATGKPVNLEPFSKLAKTDPPNPQTSLPSHGARARRAPVIQFENVERSEGESLFKHLIREGYKPETVKYWFLANDYFERLIRRSSSKEVSLMLNDLQSLFDLAFERNGKKTMSEVDMGFVGLVFSKFGGEVPVEYLEMLERILVDLARIRDKRQDYLQALDYARLTIRKAKIFWERVNRKVLSVLMKAVRNSKNIDALAENLKRAGYSTKNAYYAATLKCLIDFLSEFEVEGEGKESLDPEIVEDLTELILEHLDLYSQAFRSAKWATPKDVDSMIVKLALEKDCNLERLKELIEVLAFIRGKPLQRLEGYAGSLILKVQEELKKEKRFSEREESFNGNNNNDFGHFGLDL